MLQFTIIFLIQGLNGIHARLPLGRIRCRIFGVQYPILVGNAGRDTAYFSASYLREASRLLSPIPGLPIHDS